MRKTFSIFLSFVLMMSVICANVAYADDFLSDTEKSKFEHYIGLLESIGVLDADNRKEYHETVTRAELAEILMRVTKNENFTGYEHLNFDDVTDEETQKYASTVVGLGIMSETGENMFSPEREVLGSEAVTAVVRLLGYEIYAQQNGGYPIGYIDMAQKLDILSKSDVGMNYPITYRSLINIIIKASEADMLTISYEGNNPKYEVKPENTIMANTWKLDKRSGLVTANSRTALTTPTAASEGVVGIDGKLYNVRDDYDHLLGYHVEYYVSYDSGEIVYIDDCSYYNKVITIDAEDIDVFENRTYKCHNYDTGKKYDVKLSSSIDVIYNGSALTKYTNEDLIPADGNVTLIDNDRCGLYDVVIINSYSTIVVGSIDTQGGIIYDLFDNKKNVNYSQYLEEYTSVTDADGNSMKIERIKPNSVLSVAQSKDFHALSIIVSTQLIKGSAEQIKLGGDIPKIKMNGVWYKTVKDSFDWTTIKIGDYGTFYINYQNRITSFDSGISTELRRGYLVKAYLDDEGGDYSLALKIFDESGTMRRLDCAEKVQIDGLKAQKADSVYNSLKKGQSKILPQLMFYKTNENGLIYYIDTPYNNQPEYIERDKDNAPYMSVLPQNGEDENSLRLTYSSIGTEYRWEQMIFGKKSFVTDKTTYFRVPSDVENANDDDFRVLNITNFRSGEYYQFDAYSCTEDPLNTDIIITTTNVGGGGRIAIIDSVDMSVREDDIVYSLTMYTQNGKEEFWTDNFSIVEEMKASNADDTNTYTADVGDIVNVSVNSSKRISSMTLMIDASEADESAAIKMPKNPSSDEYNASNRLIYGNVYSKYGNIISVTTDSLPSSGLPITLTQQSCYNVSKFPIYIYTKQGIGKGITAATADDILDYIHCGQGYSKVAVVTDNVNPRLIVIFKDN